MKTAYINGILLDGKVNMKPEKGLIIVTENEKIVSVSQDVDLSQCEIVDLKGKYIMPGLVNMHVHLPASGKPKKKQTDAKKLVKLMQKINLKIQAYLRIKKQSL